MADKSRIPSELAPLRLRPLASAAQRGGPHSARRGHQVRAAGSSHAMACLGVPPFQPRPNQPRALESQPEGFSSACVASETLPEALGADAACCLAAGRAANSPLKSPMSSLENAKSKTTGCTGTGSISGGKSQSVRLARPAPSATSGTGLVPRRALKDSPSARALAARSSFSTSASCARALSLELANAVPTCSRPKSSRAIASAHWFERWYHKEM
mmetsp:Transcript_18017/g.45795  ORF Transcript_18017/g.45795 Transcript_18017/m.45795 type:complete len:215 (-) Transcript_18017:1401-2045(-)